MFSILTMYKRLQTKVTEQKTEVSSLKKSIESVAVTVDQDSSDYLAKVWDRLEELERNYENLEKSCLAQLNKIHTNPVFLRLSQHKPLKINRRSGRGSKQPQPQTTSQPQHIDNNVNDSNSGINIYMYQKECIYPHNDSVFN